MSQESNTETAILAGGCFWPAQELLRHRDGVISTRVGFTGGKNDNPTDVNHPGHAEAVEIVFDPERISYRDLLEFFFQIHRPDLDERVVGSDYRSEIFYTSDEQRRVAEGTIADTDASGIWPGEVVTEISEGRPILGRRGRRSGLLPALSGRLSIPTVRGGSCQPRGRGLAQPDRTASRACEADRAARGGEASVAHLGEARLRK